MDIDPKILEQAIEEYDIGQGGDSESEVKILSEGKGFVNTIATIEAATQGLRQILVAVHVGFIIGIKYAELLKQRKVN